MEYRSVANPLLLEQGNYSEVNLLES